MRQLTHPACRGLGEMSTPCCGIHLRLHACEACLEEDQSPTASSDKQASKEKCGQQSCLGMTTSRCRMRVWTTYVRLRLLSKHVATATARVNVFPSRFRVRHNVRSHLVVSFHVAAAQRVVVGQCTRHFLLRSRECSNIRHYTHRILPTWTKM